MMERESHIEQPPTSAADLPPAFPALFALVCFHAIMAFAYFHARTPLLFLGAIITSVAIIYGFWRGQNWARIVVILTAVTDFVIDIPRLTGSPPLMRFVLISRLLSAVALLIWLNTSTVRVHFRRSPNKTMQPTADRRTEKAER
jgi:hypothetical protein